MTKNIKRAFHLAHLAAAVTVGIAISSLDSAPLRTIIITGAAFIVLVWSYEKMYHKPKCESETPIGDQVAKDLGFKG
jgi:hypothetical protein